MEVQASVKYSASCDLDRSEHNSRFNMHIAQSIKNAIEGSRVCEPRIANLCMVVIYKSYLEGLAHRPQSN